MDPLVGLKNSGSKEAFLIASAINRHPPDRSYTPAQKRGLHLGGLATIVRHPLQGDLGESIPPRRSLLEPGLVLLQHNFTLYGRRKSVLRRLTARPGPLALGCHRRDEFRTTQSLFGLRHDAGSGVQGAE